MFRASVIALFAMALFAAPAQAGFLTPQIKSSAKAVAMKVKSGGAHGHPAPTFSNPAAGVETEGGGSSDSQIAAIIECESGSDYSANTGNGFTGAGQWMDSTWQSAGGSTQSAYQASPGEQDAVMRAYIDANGTGAWPVCGQ